MGVRPHKERDQRGGGPVGSSRQPRWVTNPHRKLAEWGSSPMGYGDDLYMGNIATNKHIEEPGS